jgi:hypothetical protein
VFARSPEMIKDTLAGLDERIMILVKALLH